MKTTFYALLTIASAVNIHACPGSPASFHASCEMTISFPNTSCKNVANEIVSRAQGNKGWKDPHNNGQYQITQKNVNKIEGSRLTGDKLYTDLFDFEMKNNGSGGCNVTACSESQVNSILDFSTNYCNLRMLYCNSSDGCKTVGKDMEYTENFDWFTCSQRQSYKCIVGEEAEF